MATLCAGLFLFSICSCGAAMDPTYTNWPAAPDWVALSNHLNSCYVAIRDRCLIVNPALAAPFDPPTYLYPTHDYERLARKVDELAPWFVDQTEADENGAFDDYFGGTNEFGEYRTDFPFWTVSNLHAAAGFEGWATNNVLTLWMTSDHCVQTQLVAAINLLTWTRVDAQVSDSYSEAGRYKGEGFSWAEAVSNYSRIGSSGAWPYVIVDRGGEPANFNYAAGISDSFFDFDEAPPEVVLHIPWNPTAAGAPRDWQYRGDLALTITLRAATADFTYAKFIGNGITFFFGPVDDAADQIITGTRTVEIPSEGGVLDEFGPLPQPGGRRHVIGELRALWGSVSGTARVDSVTFIDDLVSIEGIAQVVESDVLYAGLSSDRHLYAKGARTQGSYALLSNYVWEAAAGAPQSEDQFAVVYESGASAAAVEEYTALLLTNVVKSESLALQSGWGMDSGQWLVKWDVQGGLDPIDESDPAPNIEVPDTDRDDIVDVDAAAFETDTGGIGWRTDQDAPEVVLPLSLPPAWSAGPAAYHYISQGAFLHLPYHYLVPNGFSFSPCLVPPPPAQDPAVDDDGYYLADSLNTRVLQSRADFGVAPPVKRVALRRPRGNIVVFELPWQGSSFSRIGNPIGINSNRTYVLRDVTPDDHSDLSFDLYFDSGVVHRFGVDHVFECILSPTLEYFIELSSSGRLTEVVDSATGSVVPMPPSALRHDASPAWNAGRLASVTYGARPPGLGVITATLDYDTNGLITSISKTGIPGIGRANAAYDAASATISNGWGSTTRSQTAGVGTSRTVTITRELTDVGTLTEEFDFNAADRLAARRLTVNGDTAVTTLAYAPETGRYANGMPKGAKVERIDYPDGSSRSFGYAPDTGWLTNRTEAIDNGLSRVWSYGYEPAADEGDTGDPPNATNLVERPRNAVLTVGGAEVGRRYFSYTGNSQTIIKDARSAGAAWNDPANLVATNDFVAGGDRLGQPALIRDPAGSVQFSYAGGDVLKSTATDSGGEIRTTWINAFGNVERNVTTENGQTVDSAISTVDSFGRPLRTDFNDGSFTDNQLWHFLGPLQAIDIDGSTIDYLYYSNGWVRRIDRPAFDRTTEFEYDPLGNVTRRVESGGGLSVTNTWTYDALGRLTEETDPLGETTYSYTEESFGTRMTGTLPDGSTWTEDRYFDGRLKEISGDAAPAHLGYAHGVEGGRWFEKEIRVGDGNESNEFTQTYFNMLGNPVEVQRSGRAGSIVIEEDHAGRSAQRRDEEGTTWNTTYNARGDVEHFGRNLGGAGPLDFTTDRVRTHQRTVDGDGVSRKVFVYPQQGVATTSELGAVSRSLDTRTRTIELDGRCTIVQRGPYSSPGVHTSTETRSDGTRTVSMFRKWLPETVVVYDAASNEVSRESYAYDGLDFLVSVSNSLDGVTTYTPDATRRLKEIDPPDAGPTILTYETDTSRVASRALPDGNTERFEYFADGRLKRRYDGGQYDVGYSYDSQGRARTQTTLKDGTPVVTEWRYHPDTGRLDEKLIDDIVVASYTYRNNEDPATSTDGEGVVRTATYDTNNVPTGAEYSDGSPPETITGFDRLNRPIGAALGGVTDNYIRSLDGRPLTNAITGSGIVPDASIAYAYQPGQANFATIVCDVTGAPSRTLTFSNDVTARLASLVAGPITVEYRYEPGSDLVNRVIVRKSGVPVLDRTIAWDAAGERVAAISNVCNGQVVASFAYGYVPDSDRIGRITREDGCYWDYAYDGLLHLSSACCFSPGCQGLPGLDFGYAYDSIGNPTNAGPIDAGEPLYSFTANNRNEHIERNWSDQVDVLGSSASNVTVTVNDGPVMRLGEWFCARFTVDNAAGAAETNFGVHAARYSETGDVDIVAADEGGLYVPKKSEAPGHDATGVRTSDSRFTYDYDARERLVEATSIATDPLIQLRFRYYADGRRARKEVYSDLGGAWQLERAHQFIYDGWNLVFEQIDDYSLTHNPAAPDDSRWREYLWGLDLGGQRTGRSADMQSAGGVGGLLAITTSEGRTYVPTPDHVGSVHRLVDADTDQVVAEYLYDPYGRLIGEFGPAADDCPFRFNTKYYDPETELLYYGLRFYDASGGKWLTRDPIGEAGGENLYAFARNDPVNNFDPLGAATFFAADNPYQAGMVGTMWDMFGDALKVTPVSDERNMFGARGVLLLVDDEKRAAVNLKRWMASHPQRESIDSELISKLYLATRDSSTPYIVEPAFEVARPIGISVVDGRSKMEYLQPIQLVDLLESRGTSLGAVARYSGALAEYSSTISTVSGYGAAGSYGLAWLAGVTGYGAPAIPGLLTAGHGLSVVSTTATATEFTARAVEGDMGNILIAGAKLALERQLRVKVFKKIPTNKSLDAIIRKPPNVRAVTVPLQRHALRAGTTTAGQQVLDELFEDQ